MYGGERSIAAVLESLLALDHDDYAIVAIDDCSPDATLEIARRCAEADPRLVVEANPVRLGMIGNWNRVLERAYALFPELEYFAWASDNDLREPSWISTLVRELESEPGAALAYSRFGMIEDGEKVVRKRTKWVFETRGIASPVRRFAATMGGVRAGPTMYGLHRRSTLERAGNVPPVLLSDFAFLSHLSLYGTFLQAEEVLWYRDRRQMTGSSPRRQRAALFAEPSPLTYLPVPLQHAVWLFRSMVLEDRRPPAVSRPGAALLSVYYLVNWCLRLARRGEHQLEKRRRKLARRNRKRVDRLKRRVLRTSLGNRAWQLVRSRIRD
jgi:glycosyltransferase involved in cell wall biosynthesis